ncbi:DUF4013 domain-containing protein [Methanobrevibacter sp.]|uniref:DUF4013 domain-containing protein n=1 Tax=Methanobrevibacter sp. TaxID=66852 RepID=UPI0025EDC8C5|nr:DUF4013 domain-containing protein [Methanobrevibacter sp.]MBQ2666610.1 DUF4013 domain-containing protein [Methanobrevibacter sp.]
MELMEIFKDALAYPVNNIKALLIYAVLGIILGIATIGTVTAISVSYAAENILALIGSGILGIIVALIIGFLISGYELDIVKYGIQRDEGAPAIDFIRQFINGVKYFVVSIVYMIIPIVVASLLAIFFQNWISQLILVILTIIFSLALIMAQCRLAKTEDLGSALAIGEAIGDITRVGVVKLILFIIAMFIILFVLYFIVMLIAQWNSTIGGILMGILGVYTTFFMARATGLLYSEV